MGHQTRYLVFVEVSQASLSPASETGSWSVQGVDEAALQVAGGHLTENSNWSLHPWPTAFVGNLGTGKILTTMNLTF